MVSHCNTPAHAARLLALQCGADNPDNNLKALALKQQANKAFELGNHVEAEQLYTEVIPPLSLNFKVLNSMKLISFHCWTLWSLLKIIWLTFTRLSYDWAPTFWAHDRMIGSWWTLTLLLTCCASQGEGGWDVLVCECQSYRDRPPKLSEHARGCTIFCFCFHIFCLCVENDALSLIYLLILLTVAGNWAESFWRASFHLCQQVHSASCLGRLSALEGMK